MSQIQRFQTTITTRAAMIVVLLGVMSVVLAAGSSSIQFSASRPPGPGSQTSPQLNALAVAATQDDNAKRVDNSQKNERQQQTTSLIVSATNEPYFAPGSDGRTHIEYDLIHTNATNYPVILTSVQVFNGRGQQLLVLEGEALKAVTQTLGLGGATELGEPTVKVAGSGALATVIDLIVPNGEVPKRLTHRIAYQLDPQTPEINQALIGSLSIEGPELEVDRRDPIVIAPPLSGDGWLNGNGCCEMTIHRTIRLIAGGSRFVKPEAFAIDWVQVQGNRFFSGDGTSNEQHFAYGAEVKSVADGEVVFVRDGLPDATPFQPPLNIKLPLDFGGNEVVVRIRPGVFATYVHLQPGSIEVGVGEHVRTGQRLGLLGNSGNSTAPHLHFGLSDGVDILTSNSLPFVIDRYLLVGTVAPDSTPTDVHILRANRLERETHPLVNTVIDFR
jgi:murein DD-endopeptidase MepM/ murein hydrolase activator NlpD